MNKSVNHYNPQHSEHVTNLDFFTGSTVPEVDLDFFFVPPCLVAILLFAFLVINLADALFKSC
jgi:hypothetical protein